MLIEIGLARLSQEPAKAADFHRIEGEIKVLEADASLRAWGWFFLALYIGAMLVFGVFAMRKVRNSDDFATARNSYGPLFLAFALTATTASGGTFLGIPAIGYTSGFSALWYAFVYPLGTYVGLLICFRGIRRAGSSFGTRSMPEYLGERYDSEAVRLLASIFSILLLFYLAGQLLAGGVMFNKMMGVELLPALLVTALIIMFYIVIGGAHADILTDGVQGALMLLLSLAVTAMFIGGFTLEGGFSGMVQTLKSDDPHLVEVLHPNNPILNSWWDVFAIFMMHTPLGLLPHVANKLWALKSDREQKRFIVFAFTFGMILPAITFGGILARAIIGDDLVSGGGSANDAIPALFVAVLPTWVAALVGAGVLAAVMSTADGLVVSTSQIFANDIYRLSIVPRLKNTPSEETIDRVSLRISRIASALVIAGAIWLAWESQTMNVALLIAAGIGGMTSAITGPMFAGILWRGTTKAGALAGFLVGALVFIITKANWLRPSWFEDSAFETVGLWLISQAPNPFACGAIGSLSSIVAVIIVSLATKRMQVEHLSRFFSQN